MVHKLDKEELKKLLDFGEIEEVWRVFKVKSGETIAVLTDREEAQKYTEGYGERYPKLNVSFEKIKRLKELPEPFKTVVGKMK